MKPGADFVSTGIAQRRKIVEIDYGKIVTNALSTLVAAVFVGAAVIVWNAATSVDEKISLANKNTLNQQAAIQATQKTIVPKLVTIEYKIEEIENQLKSINKILAESETLRGKISYNPNQPFILKEFHKKADSKIQKKEEWDKLQKEIDMKQIQIFEQSYKK